MNQHKFVITVNCNEAALADNALHTALVVGHTALQAIDPDKGCVLDGWTMGTMAHTEANVFRRERDEWQERYHALADERQCMILKQADEIGSWKQRFNALSKDMDGTVRSCEEQLVRSSNRLEEAQERIGRLAQDRERMLELEQQLRDMDAAVSALTKQRDRLRAQVPAKAHHTNKGE